MRRSVGPMRRIACLIGVAALALVPAAARADGPPAWTVTTSLTPCYVNYCYVGLRFDPSLVSKPPVTVTVDWDHQGPADGVLAADAPVAVCGRPPAAPGDPAVPQYPCYLYGGTYSAAGDHLVAIDVKQADDTTQRYTQVVTAVDLPAPPQGQPYSGPYVDPAPVTPTPRPVIKPAPRPTTKTPTPSKRRPSSRSPSAGGYALCRGVPANVSCRPGNGSQTVGGGEKVSHKGWPAITGVFWKVEDSRGHPKTGGPDNDELLGHHGSDRLNGGAGKDVLWGDWDPANNNTRQHDVLRGGAGNDFIYPSHGQTETYAGAGKDYIWAFYGHGTIDCGPGYDTVRVRSNGAFKLRNCEVVGHFCQYGPNGNGGCLKPGESRKAVRRRASAG